MRKIFFFLIIIIVLSCTKKNTEIIDIKEENNFELNSSYFDNENENNEETLEFASEFIGNKLFVIPSDGLNLRTEPSVIGTKIILLSQNTELTVLDINKEKEIVDGLYDYWYKVDTGKEIGWVFGGYLAKYPIVIKNSKKLVPYFIYDYKINIFPNGVISNVEGAIEYNNKEKITIYENKNKESLFSIKEYGKLYLFIINDSSGWLYSITDEAEPLGYIFIYDISEKSYYGDYENNEKSGNRFLKSMNDEYDILKKYENINRYGPLLQINHNNNIIEFWDTYNGRGGYYFQINNYYSNYNELLVTKYYYEGSNTQIYDLKLKKVKCEYLGTNHIYFNESRTCLFSLGWSYGGGIFAEVKIFNIINGIYNLIFDKEIYGLEPNVKIDNISWVNNNEITIDSSIGRVKLLLDNNEVNEINNLVFEY